MYFKQRSETLKAMDLSDNLIADTIRKGVITYMDKKVEEIDKNKATPEAPTPDDKVTKVKEPGTSGDEPSEESEVLKTLKGVEEQIAKMTPKKETDKAVEKSENIEKSVKAMAGTIAKMADLISQLGERLLKVEQQPAAPKSKAAFVHKSIGADGGDKPEKKDEPSGEVAVKKARLEELEKIYDKIGPNEFAKAGFSLEAGKIQNELAVLATQK
jgi:hypothetical protein